MRFPSSFTGALSVGMAGLIDRAMLRSANQPGSRDAAGILRRRWRRVEWVNRRWRERRSAGRPAGVRLCPPKTRAYVHTRVNSRRRLTAIARELLNPILAEGSGVAINEAMAETIDAVAKATIGMTEAEGANSKTIAKLLKLDQSATWRRLWGACADGHIVNLEQRYRMPGKYRVAGQKPETSTILPGTAELIGRFTTPPPETVHTCIRDAIADISLEDNVCKDVCTPAAYGSRAQCRQ